MYNSAFRADLKEQAKGTVAGRPIAVLFFSNTCLSEFPKRKLRSGRPVRSAAS